jgi:hypothetical protein
MKRILALFSIFFLLQACSPPVKEDPQQLKLERMTWLIGTWKNVDGDFTTYEIWEKKSDKLFSGKSFSLQGNDTVFYESITLQQNGNETFYIPTVRGQNENKPVAFKFLKWQDGEFIFENKEHDFPQQIVYKNPQPDFLCARIQGKQDGKEHHEDFDFVRVK